MTTLIICFNGKVMFNKLYIQIKNYLTHAVMYEFKNISNRFLRQTACLSINELENIYPGEFLFMIDIS